MPLPVPHRLDTGVDAALIAHARRELDGLSDAMRRFPYADLLIRTLNRREAVGSSQIEGTRTGFDELLLYELALGAEDAPDDADASETLAYVQAWMHGAEAIQQNGVAALNQALICNLHAILMAREPRAQPGEYRTIQNYIGSTLELARYVPPPPEAIPALMADLEGLLQYEPEDVMFAPVLTRAAIAHVQFEAIHPFRDGNGRTGRMLLPLMFLAEGDPPVHLASFLKLRQQAYYDALLGVQMQLDWGPWVALFLECVIASCQHTVGLIAQLETLLAQWTQLLNDAGKRKHATVRKLLPLLAGHPVLSTREVAKLLDVSFPAANTAINDLVELDILRLARGQQRNRYFQAHQVLNAMYAGMDEVLRNAERHRHFFE